jgi:hypothetical protein
MHHPDNVTVAAWVMAGHASNAAADVSHEELELLQFISHWPNENALGSGRPIGANLLD